MRKYLKCIDDNISKFDLILTLVLFGVIMLSVAVLITMPVWVVLLLIGAL